MKIVSQLLPRGVRRQLRRSFDSLYSKPVQGKETIGALSQWTIVTRNLRPESVVYSGGVGEDITFEQELIRRFGFKIHIFDPSPVAAATIARVDNKLLDFKALGLSASTTSSFSVGGGVGDKTWFKAGGETSVLCTTLEQEMRVNGHTVIDLLKIDIEGFEYEVLQSCLNAKIPVNQICVEFHDFFPDISRAKTRDMKRTLAANGFELIHRHRHDHTFLRRQSE